MLCFVKQLYWGSNHLNFIRESMQIKLYKSFHFPIEENTLNFLKLTKEDNKMSNIESGIKGGEFIGYNSKSFNVDKMKRTKSTLTLKNLAMSIKKSIQFDKQKATKKDCIPFRSSKSVAHCVPKERNSGRNRADRVLNREQKQNKVFVLEKQITSLEKQLSQFQKRENGHPKELLQYEEIQKKQLQSEKDICSEKLNSELIKNQILMLQEDINSCQFNMESRIAEKQYHQEIIDTYQHQFQAQCKLINKIDEIQQQNIIISNQIKNLEQFQDAKKRQFQGWKEDIQFDLNQHKLKNSIKIVRTKLISLQDKCDQYCSQNQLRKIRQLYCIFFKGYSTENQIEDTLIEEGIDIFVCKKRICQDFSQFLRQRLVYNKPAFPLIEQYLSNLLKMQQIYIKSHFQSHKKVYCRFTQDLEQLQSTKYKKYQQIYKNQQQIKRLTSQIDELFNNQSIAVIEYMREQNRNTYDIKEIKKKLRQNRKEQANRTNMVKLSLNRIRQLELIIEKSNLTLNLIANCSKLQIQDLSEHLIFSELRLQQQQRTYFTILKKKNTIEERINQRMTKWREMDEKKSRLKILYKELDSANHWQNKSAIKLQQYGKEPKELKYKHSKNSSLSSLHQSKPLSLSHPYKKIMQKPDEIYQPTISNCQMILSNKLINKDPQFKCYKSKESKQKREAKSAMTKEKSNSSMKKKSMDKENDVFAITGKKSIKPTKSRENQQNTQKLSLSRLLICRFNR